MNHPARKSHPLSSSLKTITITITLALSAAATPALAGLPSPDNAVWGEIKIDGDAVAAPLTVEAREVDADGAAVGDALASYTLGDNAQAAANQFVVRVKIDTSEVTRPGAVLPGTRFALFIDGVRVTAPLTAGDISNVNALFRNVNVDIDPKTVTNSAKVTTHLLAGSPKMSALELLASDANKDGAVDAADIVVLRGAEALAKKKVMGQ
ncbi:hypothetical protein BH09SUM1_BH09SUM1_19130 [soil metagenome]